MFRHPAHLFKVLSVETRVRILEMLRERGNMGAKKIAEELGISVAAVSQHLKVMHHANLVTGHRRGYHIPYSVNEDTLMHCRLMMNRVCHCGCEHHRDGESINHEFHQHHNHHHHGTGQMDIKDLIEYKKILEHELEVVQARIDSLKE